MIILLYLGRSIGFYLYFPIVRPSLIFMPSILMLFVFISGDPDIGFARG